LSYIRQTAVNKSLFWASRRVFVGALGSPSSLNTVVVSAPNVRWPFWDANMRLLCPMVPPVWPQMVPHGVSTRAMTRP
jgi:hypothetical protein